MRRVLVTVANPSTEDTLLNLAIVLTKAGGGTLLPLNVLSDHKKAVSAADKRRQVQLLEIAEDIAHAAVTKVEPIGRVDDAIDKGILRTAVEQDASLIVCGWKGYSSYKDNFFGDVLDNVARQAHVPVLVTRFVYPVSNTGRIIFAVNKQQALSENFAPTLKIMQTIATELKSTPQILVVTGRRESRLSDAELAELSPDIEVEQTKGNLFKRISKRLQPNDLLVLEVNTRKKPVTMRPAIGQVPEEVVRSHPEVSIIVAHYP